MHLGDSRPEDEAMIPAGSAPGLVRVGGVADPDRIETRQDFGRELTLLKEQAGLTVRDAARALGIPAGTIGDYLAGRHLPVRLPDLQKILLVFGVEDEEEARKWLAALSRVRRPPGPRPAGAPAPYRGLASFQQEDADWFYGREELTSVLVGHLSHQYAQGGGLLVVVGPSGSGKSSLLRAGLISQLESGALDIPGSHIWPVKLFTPGTRPVHELARQLATLTGANPDHLATALLSQPACCSDLARQSARPEGNGSRAYGNDGERIHRRLVMVVDQFEEIFTACQDEPERHAFITALCAVAGQDADNDADTFRADSCHPEPAALIVLGLRADFYPHALRYPALVPALQNHQVLVTPMTETEVRSVIVRPARRAGLGIEEGLVEVLLRDLAPAAGHNGSAAHDAGALPLLSHALRSTWERSRGRRLTVANYQDIGGIQGAVARTAEQAFSDLTPDQQELARQIFIRLVHVADDTADTRRRVPRNELLLVHGDVQPVLDVFIDKRLITAGTDDVEIAHEALLLAWPRLHEWIDNDRAGVHIHRQLTSAAEIWRDSGHDPSTLYGGDRLATASDWVGEPAHADDLNVLEREFLDASIEHKLAEQRTARLRTRRLQRLAAALAALFLIAGLLAVFAYQQKDAATYQRDLAISRQLAADADQLRSTDVALAMQLSLEAYRIAPTTEAYSSLVNSTALLAATRMLGSIGTEMHSAAFNSSKTILAAGSADGTVRLWDVLRQGHPVSLSKPLTLASGAVTSIAFSPNSQILATSTTNGTVWLWNVDNPRRPTLLDRVFLQPTAVVNSIAFSPDGLTLNAA